MNENTTTESLARGAGTEHPPVAPARASESEEWAWMVDEDPAFYLSQGGLENTGG